jgi:glycosyltransferase involved in cell wall biosynthesis
MTFGAILPNYNHAEVIGRQIESLLAQKRPYNEILIADDASTDNSIDVIQKFACSHPSIKFFANPNNLGVIKTSNELLKKTCSDYIGWHAADDLVEPRFIEVAERWLSEYPHAKIVVGQVNMLDDVGAKRGINKPNLLSESQFLTPEDYFRRYLLKEKAMSSLSPSVLYRRDSLIEIGGFLEEMDMWTDTFAVHSLALLSGAIYINEPCTSFTCSTSSGSSKFTRNPSRVKKMIAAAQRRMKTPPNHLIFKEGYPESWGKRYETEACDIYIYQRVEIGWRNRIADRDYFLNQWSKISNPILKSLGGILFKLFYKIKFAWCRLAGSLTYWYWKLHWMRSK